CRINRSSISDTSCTSPVLAPFTQPRIAAQSVAMLPPMALPLIGLSLAILFLGEGKSQRYPHSACDL
ncbi:MAG: hypothetical protein ACK44Q_01080, partial [Pirellulaceae bacterium]